MNREGYVINYGKNQSVFAEDAVFLKTLEYLQNMKCRILKTYWIVLSDEEQQAIHVLVNSSFGYRIEYAPIGEETNEQSIFVTQEELKSTCKRLHEQGYKIWGFNWACPVIDRMKGSQRYMNNRYHNGGATEEQLADLKSLCDKLLAVDETQKGFIDQISEKTGVFQYVSEETCTILINLMKEIIAAYK